MCQPRNAPSVRMLLSAVVVVADAYYSSQVADFLLQLLASTSPSAFLGDRVNVATCQISAILH